MTTAKRTSTQLIEITADGVEVNLESKISSRQILLYSCCSYIEPVNPCKSTKKAQKAYKDQINKYTFDNKMYSESYDDVALQLLAL